MVPTQIPDEFVCPITFDIMEDPVVAADGTTYERRAIEVWLQNHTTSPKTNELLKPPFYRNLNLKSLIGQWLVENPDWELLE